MRYDSSSLSKYFINYDHIYLIYFIKLSSDWCYFYCRNTTFYICKLWDMIKLWYRKYQTVLFRFISFYELELLYYWPNYNSNSKLVLKCYFFLLRERSMKRSMNHRVTKTANHETVRPNLENGKNHSGNQNKWKYQIERFKILDSY